MTRFANIKIVTGNKTPREPFSHCKPEVDLRGLKGSFSEIKSVISEMQIIKLIADGTLSSLKRHKKHD